MLLKIFSSGGPMLLNNSGRKGPFLLKTDKLKTVWRDGTSHLLFEPLEFLEKLAAIIPRLAVNLVLYRGVLTPHARWRARVVRYGRPAPDAPAREHEASPRAAGTPGAWRPGPP